MVLEASSLLALFLIRPDRNDEFLASINLESIEIGGKHSTP